MQASLMHDSPVAVSSLVLTCCATLRCTSGAMAPPVGRQAGSKVAVPGCGSRSPSYASTHDKCRRHTHDWFWQVGKKIADIWKGLPENEKEGYKQRAGEAKAEYDQLNPKQPKQARCAEPHCIGREPMGGYKLW